MRKIISIALVALMIFSGFAFAKNEDVKGKKSSQEVYLNGEKVDIGAYLINDSNYLKLRDVAAILSKTEGKFDVSYNKKDKKVEIALGKEYVKEDSDLQPLADGEVEALISKRAFVVDGKDLLIETALISGNNFLKLRELGEAVGLNVSYDKEKKAVIIETKEAKKTEENKEENKEEKFDEKNAREVLKNILDSKDMSKLESKGINTKANEESIKALKEGIKRAEELLAKEKLTEEELKELKDLTKFEGKKYRGTLAKLVRAVVVDQTVEGDRETVNKNNEKKYPALKDNKIVIKTSLPNVKKIGDANDNYLKINYVTKEQYDEIDVMSEATPKYKKQELDKSLYTVTEKDGVITVEITGELPADAVILKPVLYSKFADKLFFENGDLVYIVK